MVDYRNKDRSITASTFLTDVPIIADCEQSYYVNPTEVRSKPRKLPLFMKVFLLTWGLLIVSLIKRCAIATGGLTVAVARCT